MHDIAARLTTGLGGMLKEIGPLPGVKMRVKARNRRVKGREKGHIGLSEACLCRTLWWVQLIAWSALAGMQ